MVTHYMQASYYMWLTATYLPCTCAVQEVLLSAPCSPVTKSTAKRNWFYDHHFLFSTLHFVTSHLS